MSTNHALSKPLTIFLLLGIAALTVLCFLPVLSNDYVNFDDTKYVIFNPAIQELTWDSLGKIWMTVRGEQYHYVPLTLTSFAIEYKIHNLIPRAYHADNLFLHALNVFLVYGLILSLCKDWKLAALVSLLFGIHPMHVESVAWVSERKDVLYAFFYLFGLIHYVNYIDKFQIKYLWVAFFCLLLALFSKPMAVTFPLIMLLIDWQRQRPFNGKLFIEKTHFFIASVAFAYMTTFEKNFPVVEFEKGYSWLQRFFIACYTFVSYSVKSLWPLHQSVYYPLPTRLQGELPAVFLWASVLTLILLAGFIYVSRRSRTLLFGGLFFVASIVLVLNFYPLGNILMADHYTYLSYIGLFIIIAQCILSTLKSQKLSKSFRLTFGLLALLWMGILFTKAYQRCYVWSNSETLWVDVIEQFPDDPVAYYNLADYYVRTNRLEEAIEEYSNAIKADPDYFSAYHNRANLYMVLGELDQAQQDYQKTLAINPQYGRAFLNLARLYEQSGRIPQAIEMLHQMLVLDPQAPGIKEYLSQLQQKTNETPLLETK